MTTTTRNAPSKPKPIILTKTIAPSQDKFSNSANPEKTHFIGGSEPSSGFWPENQVIAEIFKSKNPPLTWFVSSEMLGWKFPIRRISESTS